MSNFQTHKEETKAVRAALKAAGINARVGHGRGTSWGWLKLNIGDGQQWGEHVARKSPNYEPCPPECVRCFNLREMEAEALQVSQEVTGRHGDYDGRISILTQDDWNPKRKENVSIDHPNWTTRYLVAEINDQQHPECDQRTPRRAPAILRESQSGMTLKTNL